ITNGKTTNLNADLGFEQLYNKSRFLRAVYSNAPTTNQQNNNPPNNNTSKTRTPNNNVKTDSLTRKEARKLRKAQKQNSLPEVNGIVKGAAKLVTSLKRVGIQYTETSGTSLPGYLDSTRFLGQNWKSMQPGFDFILGYQPDTNWVNQKGQEGVLTKD